MSLDSDISLLSKVRMFEDFEPEHLRLLAFGAEAKHYAKDQRLYREGVYSDGGYVIVQGKVNLYSGEDEAIVSSHGPAGLIGEMALISGIDHAATAIAVEPTDVMKITRPLFRRMLEEYPDLARLLQEKIARSVGSFVDEIAAVSAKLDNANALMEEAENVRNQTAQ